MKEKFADVLKTQARSLVAEAAASAESRLQTTIQDSSKVVNEAISTRLNSMFERVQRATDQSTAQSFVGVKEEDILTFVPDERTFNGLGAVLLGLVFAILLPGFVKVPAIAFVCLAAVYMVVNYIMNSKVDVPDGYEGVVCFNGKPTGEKSVKGRNRFMKFGKFIPVLVSKRDQVVDLRVANYTADTASILLGMQLTAEIEDPALFVTKVSPAGAMKIMQLYAAYDCLRIITSIPDARVKFTGRHRLGNVVEALNLHLRSYGIRLKQCNMPVVENDILDDLESIRTKLTGITAMDLQRQVQLETQSKAVEMELRQRRKESRSAALSLQQMSITLETRVTESVNRTKQELLVEVRRRLDQRHSELTRALADFSARLDKAKSVAEAFNGLNDRLDLRIAGLKRQVLQRLIPERVEVLGVEGMGIGAGMSMGNRLVQPLFTSSNAETS